MVTTSLLELLALGADLLEAGRDDDGAGHAGLAALAHVSGTALAGTAMTARSILRGTWLMDA